MNLTYCKSCGIMYNLDCIAIPDIYDEDGCVIDGLAEYCHGSYLPIVKCRVCDGKIKVGP